MSSSGPRAVLAIEMSQRTGSVALRAQPGAALREHVVPPADDLHDNLLAVIDAICREGGVAPGDLHALLVSTGPGGFTGLRVACATAKAIADATGAAVVAVPSALVAARALAAEGVLGDGTAMVALAAKGSTAWIETLRISGGMPRRVLAGLMDAAEFVPAPGTTALIADGHLPEPFLGAARAAGAGMLPAHFHARFCLEIGELLLASGEVIDPLLLEPSYPRAPEAVSLWESRRGASAP